MSDRVRTAEQLVVDAVIYAMKAGCFFPVPEPTAPYTVDKLTKWGAMRHLHDAVANYHQLTSVDEVGGL